MPKFNTSFVFLYSWIDVLDLNQPFNWKAEIWEPFKMKLIWGLQSWPLVGAHCCSYVSWVITNPSPHFLNSPRWGQKTLTIFWPTTTTSIYVYVGSPYHSVLIHDIPRRTQNKHTLESREITQSIEWQSFKFFKRIVVWSFVTWP